MRRPRSVLLLLAIALTALAAIEVCVAALTARRASQPVASRSPGPALDAPLLDERGARTSLAAFRGRYLVLAPSLTLCQEVCPITTGALTQLQAELRARGLGDRVVVAEASVDPWRDTPARVRAFKRRTGMDIRFLTGTAAGLRRLWRGLGVTYRRVRTGGPLRFDVTHTDGVFVIDPRGRLRLALPGMPDVRGRLSPVLERLLNAEGRANLRHPAGGWTVDQLLAGISGLLGQPAGAHAALGDQAAFRARLRALRGRPALVNEWASWCPPCRDELPLFAAAFARYGRHAGFAGLNVNDGAGAARRFLAAHPTGYPSYRDDGSEAAALGSFVGLPTTLYLDAAGQVVHTHIGQYRDAAELDADIERYAL